MILPAKTLTFPLLRIISLAAALMILSTPMPAAAQNAWAIAANYTRLGVSLNALFLPETRAEFKALRGNVLIDEKRPTRSLIALVADISSIEVSTPSVRSFLLGDQILDAARFPTLTFRSTGIVKTDALHATLSGALTLRGVTRPIDMEIEFEPKPGRLGQISGLTARGKLNRLEFGITRGYPLVTSEVEIVLTSQSGAR